MTPQTQTGPKQTQQSTAPTDFERLLQKPHEKALEFVPYGASDKIKLTVDIVQKLIAVRTRSGKTCSDRDAIRFMMMCQAQRLNPFAGDAFLIGYDAKDGPSFSLITAHQAFLKRAELHPEYDGMESGIVIMDDSGNVSDMEGDFHLPDQKIVGGWARVFFKNRKVPCYRRVRTSRFNKGFAQWEVDPAGMICKCAEADALRSSFPTMLGGLFLRDEVALNVAGNVAIEMPSNGLVDVKAAPHRTDNPPDNEADNQDGDVAPTRQAERTEEKESKTPQVELSEVVLAAGFDFTTFQRWGDESGSLPDATSLAGFREVPTETCIRLLKAFRGAKSRPAILQQLETLKGSLV